MPPDGAVFRPVASLAAWSELGIKRAVVVVGGELAALRESREDSERDGKDSKVMKNPNSDLEYS